MWVARHQTDQIEYLSTVNRALIERVGKKGLRFTDDDDGSGGTGQEARSEGAGGGGDDRDAGHDLALVPGCSHVTISYTTSADDAVWRSDADMPFVGDDRGLRGIGVDRADGVHVERDADARAGKNRAQALEREAVAE